MVVLVGISIGRISLRCRKVIMNTNSIIIMESSRNNRMIRSNNSLRMRKRRKEIAIQRNRNKNKKLIFE